MSGRKSLYTTSISAVETHAQAIRNLRWVDRNLLSSLLGLVLASVVHAQGSTTESELRSIDASRRQQEREQEQRQRLQPNPEVRLQEAPPAIPRLPLDESPCFHIQAIDLIGPDTTRIEGTTQGAELPPGWTSWLLDALDARTAPEVPGTAVVARPDADSPLHQVSGICLGSQGVSILQRRAQAALLARGYITSRALVEAQNLGSGRLRLRIVPGRIQDIRLDPPVPGNDLPWLLATASPARPDDVLNLRDLEQALENLKRVPSAEADIRIEPGTAPASSDWVVRHQQGRPLRLTFSVDDSGSPGTGVYQGSATASWDAPLGLNDLFYVTRNTDLGGGEDGNRGTRGQSLHYSLPWGYWSLGLTQSSNRYYQSVVGLNQNYVYSGTSTTTEIRLGRVLARDAISKTTASLKAFQRSSNNYIDDTEVQIQRRVVGGWEMGVAHKTSAGQGILDGSLSYKIGTGDFGSMPAPEEASGTGTSRFGLTLADINLQIPLSWPALPQLHYAGLLRWQQNLTPLTPQDRFAIGGRYTVRGFDGVNVLSAERGMLLRNELSTPLPSGWNMSTFLGLDYGYVDGPSSDNLAGKQLAGVVWGLRGAWHNVNYEVFVGTPVDKPQGFRTANTAAGFNLILTL
jgi:hemolysin activation/secretion protein